MNADLRQPPVRFPDCGTPTAYGRHVGYRQEPCTACREAHRAYMADYRRRKALLRGGTR